MSSDEEMLEWLAYDLLSMEDMTENKEIDLRLSGIFYFVL
mgnify:CR=1 FL=1